MNKINDASVLINDHSEDWYFLDLILATLIVILLSPLMIFIGVILQVTGPIFYQQIRVGKKGELFKIFKFRTMVSDAEFKSGPILSYDGDPRVTKLGSILRKTHLDELPQLFNVISGDMALIGPRPERPEFTIPYSIKIPNYSIRHSIRPGITGLAQVRLPYDAKAEQKLKYDLYYIKNKDSITLNAKIILETSLKILGQLNWKLSNLPKAARSILVASLFAGNNSYAEVHQRVVMDKKCRVENGLPMIFPKKVSDLIITVELSNQLKTKPGQTLNIALYGRLTSSNEQRLLLEEQSGAVICLDSSCEKKGFFYKIPAKKIKKFKLKSMQLAEFNLHVYSAVGALEQDSLHLTLASDEKDVLSETNDSAKIVDQTTTPSSDFVDNRYQNSELLVSREEWMAKNDSKTKYRYEQFSPAVLFSQNSASLVFLPNADMNSTSTLATIDDIRNLFVIPDFKDIVKPMDFKATPYAVFWVAPKNVTLTRYSFETFQGTQSKYVLLPGQRGQFVTVATKLAIEYQKWESNQCGLAQATEKVIGEKIIKHEELNILE